MKTILHDLDDWWENFNNIQFDITSHCNARCAFCCRQKEGTTQTKAELELHHFDLDTWKRIASEDTRGVWIREITLNGNWGDPMMHPNLVEMLDIWSNHHPETNLMLHTNGSMRSTQFWKDMGKICRKFTNHVVVFAVDGMKDTHSIYRVRTNFDKICENISAFVSTTGRARICMTAFKHNVHQVKEVEDLAERLGCIEFEIRPSHGSHTVQDGVTIEEGDTKFYQKTFENIYIEMSDLRDFDYYNVVSENYLPENNTKCPWFNDRNIQIDPWGRVWPCCHVSEYGKNNNFKHVDESFTSARDTNSLTNYSLRQILQNDWYSKHLYSVVKNAKWNACRETCGVCKDG